MSSYKSCPCRSCLAPTTAPILITVALCFASMQRHFWWALLVTLVSATDDGACPGEDTSMLQANAVQAQAALTQTRKQETSLAGRCSQKMTFENSSHTYPIRNLYWLHFPKAGTSFMATVWNYACGQGRELLDLTVSDAYAPKCLHCYDFALMERYPKDEYCTQGVLHKQFTTQHRPFSMEQIQGRTLHVAAMFRQPSQRIISAKADGLHASGLSPTGYAELRRKCEHEPTECFARYPGIAGCMTRMLTGKNCAEDSNDRTAPFDGGRALVDEAKKVVGELSFVGLTEHSGLFYQFLCSFPSPTQCSAP